MLLACCGDNIWPLEESSLWFSFPSVELLEGDEVHDVNWLLDIVNQVGTIILDVDNTRNEYQWLIGYLLSFDKTYYLTKAEEMSYNVINTRRIYDVGQIAEENNYFVKFQRQT